MLVLLRGVGAFLLSGVIGSVRPWRCRGVDAFFFVVWVFAMPCSSVLIIEVVFSF